MTRNDFGNYATKLTNFVCGGRHKRGEGKCKTWETKIDASGLSEKMRGILNLKSDDLVSLSQYREWANMKFERGFKEGPGKADKKWQVGSTISWSSYLRLIVEQGCISCGILVSRIRARGVSSEHMENMEMFSCSPT